MKFHRMNSAQLREAAVLLRESNAQAMEIIRRHRGEHGDTCACEFCAYYRNQPDFGDGALSVIRKRDWIRTALMLLRKHLLAVGAANNWTEGE